MNRSADLDRRILDTIRHGACALRVEEFDLLSLDLFAHQFERVPIYREFCERRSVTPRTVRRWEEIPSFPTIGFRHHPIASLPPEKAVAIFHTSGTTAEERGTHLLDTTTLYDEASIASFRDLAGLEIDHHALLSLIPTKEEAPHSSLAHMVDTIGRTFFGSRRCCAFRGGMVDVEEATTFAIRMARTGTPLIIASTVVALSDWLRHLSRLPRPVQLPRGSALFETGGTKGRRSLPSLRERVGMAESLLGLANDRYLGEYGMTELSSPSWGRRVGHSMVYRSPSWAPVRILDPASGEEVPVGEEGMVTVFDLANRGSVSALLTGDWGRRHKPGFEVMGRAVDRELRGCSLSVAKPDVDPKPSDFQLGTLEQIKERITKAAAPPRERAVDSLGRLTEIWQNPDSPERREFESRPALAAFSPGSIAEGLNRTFGALSREKLRTISQRIGPNDSPGLAVAVSAGNLPVTGVFGFYAGLLNGVPTIHRPSSRNDGLLEALHRSLAEIDPDLAALVSVIKTPSDDNEATRELFRGASEISVQGDDETIEHLRALAPESCRFLSYRSRFSIAIATDPSDADLRSLLEDLYIWEQQGCLSPQVLFARTSDPRSVADRLLHAADDLASEWKRIPSSRQNGEKLWKKLASEIRGDEVAFVGNAQLTVAITAKVREEWFATPGLIQLAPFGRDETVVEILQGLVPRLSSVAVGGDTKAPESLNPERIVRFGELQSPALDWAQEGHDRFRRPR